MCFCIYKEMVVLLPLIIMHKGNRVTINRDLPSTYQAFCALCLTGLPTITVGIDEAELLKLEKVELGIVDVPLEEKEELERVRVLKAAPEVMVELMVVLELGSGDDDEGARLLERRELDAMVELDASAELDASVELEGATELVVVTRLEVASVLDGELELEGSVELEA